MLNKRNAFTQPFYTEKKLVVAKRAGFTIIELIMVIVIIAIIALVTSGIFIFFMRNTIFLPNQMNVQQAADVAMDIMIEGDDRARGLRFASASDLISVGSDNIRFVNANGQTIRYEIRHGRLQRRVSNNPWELIPYYATDGFIVAGQASGLFNFFDESENPTTNSANVHRIQINLLAQSGSGNIDEWEGSTTVASSVKLYKFNQPPEIKNLVADPETISGPKKRWSLISFDVDDLDEDSVRWFATVENDPGGESTLNKASGSGNAPYSVKNIRYTPTTGYTGLTTISIKVNDDKGDEDTDSVAIQVSD